MVVGVLVIVGVVMFSPENLGQTGRWVSPVERHNAEIEAVAMEDRAYPILAKFMARDSRGEGQFEHLDVMPGDEGWDELAAWIHDPRTQELIELLARASECSILGMPMLDYEDSIWVDAMAEVGIWLEEPTVYEDEPACLILNVLLPMGGAIIRAEWYLQADALLAIEQRDMDRFVRDVRIWSKLAMFADEPKIAVGQLVQAVQLAKISLFIADVLLEHPELVDVAVAGDLDEILAGAMAADVFVFDLELEYATLEDVIRRMVDDAGQYAPAQTLAFIPMIDDGEGILPEPSWARIEDIDADLLAGYMHYKAVGQSRVDAVGMPWREVEALEEDDWGKDIVSPQGEIGKLMYPILTLGDEQLDSAVSMLRTYHQQMIGVRVAIAGHRHRLRHGDPAVGLSDIDSDLMWFDPVDGFTGGPVQYRWREGRMLVYAVGADGDDDGGVEVVRPEGVEGFLISDEYLREGWDGDMVLFPVSD